MYIQKLSFLVFLLVILLKNNVHGNRNLPIIRISPPIKKPYSHTTRLHSSSASPKVYDMSRLSIFEPTLEPAPIPNPKSGMIFPVKFCGSVKALMYEPNMRCLMLPLIKFPSLLEASSNLWIRLLYAILKSSEYL